MTKTNSQYLAWKMKSIFFLRKTSYCIKNYAIVDLILDELQGYIPANIIFYLVIYCII